MMEKKVPRYIVAGRVAPNRGEPGQTLAATVLEALEAAFRLQLSVGGRVAIVCVRTGAVVASV